MKRCEKSGNCNESEEVEKNMKAVGDEVVAHDDHGHARGAGVFLRAGVNEPVALNVERLR